MSPISQKSHDISYATFRVATLVRNKKLRAELEIAAIDLVSKYEEAFDKESLLYIPNVVDKLERLIMFAESIGEIKAINASVLKRELNNLQTAIDFHANTFKGNPNGNQDLYISSMFSANGNTMEENKFHQQAKRSNNPNASGSFNISNVSNISNDSNVSKNSNEISVRQMAILRLIKETEFCRLRNITEAMPNISERTVRNEIQSLIDKNLVRRMGGGGPHSYFEVLELSISNRQSAVSAS